MRLSDLVMLGKTKTEVQDEIVQRIGLSFEQFTRAVLLAQNEFSAFLKTEENERGALLETLTGSAIYSDISKRAYDRYKAEQNVTAQLAMRLKDQTPLPAEERAALDEQRAAADLALAAIDTRKEVLELHLRWHQDAARLRAARSAGANWQLTSAAEGAAAAAGRRRSPGHARRGAAGARAAGRQRAAGGGTGRAAGGAGTRRTGAARRRGGATAGGAGRQRPPQTRSPARNRRNAAAAPQLDRAKALDAAIATLAPAHGQAGSARDAAVRDAAISQDALTLKATQLEEMRAAREAGVAWLAAHRAA